MCCNLRIQVIVISIICIIVTGLTYMGLNEWFPHNFWYILTTEWFRDNFWNNLICLYWLTSGIMCLVGAINNIKCLLIPFIIDVCLMILVCVYSLVLAISVGLAGIIGGVFISIFFLGPFIYILIIVAKFYKEPVPVIVARQGDWVDVPERVVLQSYVAQTVTPVAAVSVAPDTQIIKSDFKQGLE